MTTSQTHSQSPRRPRFPELYDSEWLKEQYLVELLAPREIAEILGCHETSVHNALRRAGVLKIPALMRSALRKARRDAEGGF